MTYAHPTAPRSRPARGRRAASLAAVTALVMLLTAAPASGAQLRPSPAAAGATGSAAPWDPNGVALSLQVQPGTFTKPVLVTNAGDGSNRLFVVEQGGYVRIVKNGSVVGTPFLDLHLSISTGGERGLLGLAFHPLYETNGKLYVHFTTSNGSIAVNEYRVSSTNPDRANMGSGRRLMTISKPFSNHNGGHLAFGPDGYLYIGTGDGGGTGDPGNRAQSTQSLLGKMLRIDVNGTQAGFQYRMPPDNPYVGRTGYDEIFSIGLRNPWRFSFDKRWGVLFIADVGQDAHEEVNRATPWDENLGRGYNYGWKRLEGYHCYVAGCTSRGTVLPLLEYRHTVTGEDNCSITGGYVYRGQAYPALYGAYLFGDLCSGRIWGVWVSASKPAAARTLLDTNLTISSFGEAEDGTVFVVDHAGGRFYRIVGTAR